MVILLILLTAACTLATLIAIATTVLSSRTNQSQPITEVYETGVTPRKGKGFTPRTYPVEIKA
jgi:hypothetical protein